MAKVISVCGRATAGKSTLCDYVEGQLRAKQFRVRRIPFAKPLKEKAIELGWDGRKDGKGRLLLQRLGTDVCRECINEDYWVDEWLKHYETAQHDGIEFVFVDDMRFPNELATVRSLGGQAIKIVRPKGFPGDQWDWWLRFTGRMHPSEIGFANEEVDQVISNSETLVELYWHSYRIARMVSV